MKQENRTHQNQEGFKHIEKLEERIHEALKYYANVHRGSGHSSIISTRLYENSRETLLQHFQLSVKTHIVIFASPIQAKLICEQLNKKEFQSISSKEIGLSLALHAIAIKKTTLRKLKTIQVGGGTTRVYSQKWVLWSKAPDRLEAGTPPIIPVIAFALAIKMIDEQGKNIFKNTHHSVSMNDILEKDKLEVYSGKELLDKLQKEKIGYDLRVPTTEGEQPYVNLDNSASTPTFTPVWSAFRKAWTADKESSRNIHETVQQKCSRFLNAPLEKYDIIFTRNTTESINIAALNLDKSLDHKSTPVIISTILEHSSNDLPWRAVSNAQVIHLPVSKTGVLNIDKLEEFLIAYNQKHEHGKKRIELVTVSGASNVVGYCNDLKSIGALVKKHHASFMVDAAQLIAHKPIDMQEVEIDFLAFSAHKIYAPFGSGVLVARKDLIHIESAALEAIKDSGKENPGGIAALGQSLELFEKIGFDTIENHEQELTKAALHQLKEIKGLKLFGLTDTESVRFRNRLGVILFEIKNNAPAKTANYLARNKAIATRYGCLCAHLMIKQLVKIGPGLEKIQRFVLNIAPKLKLQGLIRASFGLENTIKDVQVLSNALQSFQSKETSNKQLSKKESKEQIQEFADKIVKELFQ